MKKINDSKLGKCWFRSILLKMYETKFNQIGVDFENNVSLILDQFECKNSFDCLQIGIMNL